LFFVGYINGSCGLVVRFPAYISRGPGFNYGRYQIVSLELGSLNLVRIIEELFE
jgi:hypothetical protein